MAASCATSGATSGGAATGTPGTVTVEVKDESGAPLRGAVVVGQSPINPGPAASTCCVMKTFGEATTGAGGAAVLPPPPLTFRAIEVVVRYRDWPPRSVTFAGAMEARGKTISVVLGPDGRR
jgi:hypothetical protein